MVHGSSLGNQELNLHPMQWKHGVVTTEPPAKSLNILYTFSQHPYNFRHWPDLTLGTTRMKGLAVSASEEHTNPFMNELFFKISAIIGKFLYVPSNKDSFKSQYEWLNL